MESSNSSSQAAKPDPVWKWLMMLILAGLVSAASPDLWSLIKIAAKWAMGTG